MLRSLLASALAATLLACAVPAVAAPGEVRVRLDTSAGPITLALDTRRAPRTAANFLAYVDDRRLEGTTFYRASRRKSAPRFGFIQGGIQTDWRRILPPVPHETTLMTGIRHLDATVSMARGAVPGAAGGNFFITVGATPHMDAKPGLPGYAAFGRVIAGMDTVRRILALPTGGGREAMRGQMLLKPVQILRTTRLDGTLRPTGGPRPWLLPTRRR